MREIIPLSADNQDGRLTYSAGVHQLLATRLNVEAKQKGSSKHQFTPKSDI